VNNLPKVVAPAVPGHRPKGHYLEEEQEEDQNAAFPWEKNSKFPLHTSSPSKVCLVLPPLKRNLGCTLVNNMKPFNIHM